MSYIIADAYVDSLETARNVVSQLINKQIISSGHIEVCESTYMWYGEILTKKQYHMQLLAIEDNFDRITNVIKEVTGNLMTELKYYLVSGYANSTGDWIELN